MKRDWTKSFLWFGVVLFALVYPLWLSMINPRSAIAGIIQAVIPQVVPTANKRGTATVFQLAANNSAASAGATFCDDGSGNVTTSGCNSGGGTVNGGTAGQFGYYASNGSTISGASGMTTHGVVLYEGTSTPTTTGPGSTSGFVLTSNGSGSDPTFQAAGSAGAFTLVQKQTASNSATLDFTSCLSSTYNVYEFDADEIIPATNTVEFQVLVSTNGGSSWSNSTYTYDNVEFAGDSASTAVASSTGTSSFQWGGGRGPGIGNAAGKSVTGALRLFNANSTASYKNFWGSITYTFTSSVMIGGFTTGQWQTTTAVNAVRFQFSSGNITSGTIRCYGLGN